MTLATKPAVSLIRRGDDTHGPERFEQAAHAVINAKRSEHTKKAYRRDLKLWLAFCDMSDVDPCRATIRTSTEFRDQLESNVSGESTRRVLASMSSIYKTLLRGSRVAGKRESIVTSNPFHPEVLGWPKQSNVPRARLVTDEQAESMIAGALKDADTVRGARDAAVLRLLYDTGLRRMSVAQIVRTAYKNGAVTAIVKGGKEAELVLPPESCDALDAWLALAPASEFLFPGRDRGAMHPATINKIVYQRARAVGAKHVHPHSFRAAFVTSALDSGLPLHEVQASVHHANPTTTGRYDRGARGRQVASQVAAFRKKKS